MSNAREQGLAQIELSLDPTTRLVFELTSAVKIVNEVTFSGDSGEFECVFQLCCLRCAPARAASPFDLPELILMTVAQPRDGLLRYVPLHGVQLIDGRGGCESPSVQFLRSLLDTFDMSGIGESEVPNEWRQRQTLTDESHQHHDEGDKEDQVAVRKGCAASCN